MVKHGGGAITALLLQGQEDLPQLKEMISAAYQRILKDERQVISLGVETKEQRGYVASK